MNPYYKLPSGPCQGLLPRHGLLHRLCLPLVSIGKQHIATKAARMRAPEAYTGAFGFAPPALTATIGAQRPAILFRADAIPVPVPRLGAGKTSGVYA